LDDVGLDIVVAATVAGDADSLGDGSDVVVVVAVVVVVVVEDVVAGIAFDVVKTAFQSFWPQPVLLGLATTGSPSPGDPVAIELGQIVVVVIEAAAVVMVVVVVEVVQVALALVGLQGINDYGTQPVRVA
jgi:hypothetical protein